MTIKQFAAALNRQPFQPFRLVVAGGHDVVIDAPEYACIDRRGLVIRFFGPGNMNYIIDTQHVRRIVVEGEETSEGERG